MRAIVVIVFALMLWTAKAVAGPEIYTNAELDAKKQRYAQKFAFLLEKGLEDFMTPEERKALAGVVVTHPPRGAGPLSVKSAVVEGTPMVRAPVMSLRFIEDLSVAYAWRHTHGYSLEPIDEYVAMLKYRPAGDFAGGGESGPMKALGVPPKIWEREPKVDELSLRFRNEAWAFILAHELGHLRYGHTESDVSPAEIQRQEEAADAFAVDLLGRSDTIPMGMILWFQATAGYMPNRSDFADEAAYVRWVRKEAQHPVNGRRMKNLAAAMQRQARTAAGRNRSDVLEFIAIRLDTIGGIVEDPEMQSYLRRCATVRRLDDLKRLEDRPCR